jgi:RNA polymerase sigma factor (sigma-70 family)
MSKRELPDEELVSRCLENDRASWEALVRRYGRLVYAIALRSGLPPEDASDVFQTVFVTALRNLDLLERPGSLRFWLSTIARREAWRARRELVPAEGAFAESRPAGGVEAGQTAIKYPIEVSSPGPGPDEEIEQLERAHLLHLALEHVGGRCRALLELLFFHEPPLGYREAARQLGLPLGSLGPTRARCLAKLKRALDGLGF